MKKEIGVQLWSVREPLAENYIATINKVGEIGFDYVEAYGLSPEQTLAGGIAPKEYVETVKRAGMRIVSCHSGLFAPEDAPKIIESALELETDWINIAWLSEEQRGDYYQHAENFNKIGEQLRSVGIGFGYHNHDFEFFETEKGEIPMEILLENTDPEFVSFQADIFWIEKAGYNPLEFIQKYPGRFCSYHVKDADENLDQTDIGTGIIDFAAILNDKDAGIEYVFIEDERTETPLENIKVGHDFLKNLDY